MKKISLIILNIIFLCSVAYTADIGFCRKHGSVVASCTATYGNELAVTENATDCQDNDCTPAAEADATTGWTDSNAALDSVNTAAHNGIYHLSAVADAADDHFYRGLSGSAGTIYKVSAYVRHNGDSGANWRCYLASSGSSLNTYLTVPLTSAGHTTYAEYKKYFYYHDAIDTVVCQERGANTGGIYLDDFDFKTATLCYGSEKNTATDAATIGANETDDYTDWTVSGAETIDSVTTDPGDGTYHITFAANAVADGRFYRDVSSLMTTGHKYFISWKVKYVSGDSATCGLFTTTGLGTSYDAMETIAVTSGMTVWTQLGFSVNYDRTHTYFGCRENGGTNNAAFYFDAFSIKEITGE